MNENKRAELLLELTKMASPHDGQKLPGGYLPHLDENVCLSFLQAFLLDGTKKNADGPKHDWLP